jgi:S1-C subfamily serine protease
MTKFKKILSVIAVTATLSLTAVFGGCMKDGADGSDGTNGLNGQDVSIYEIYEATNSARQEEGLSTLTFNEFVKEYLSYSGDEVTQMTSLETAINRSLLSGVSIVASFNVTTSTYNKWTHIPQSSTETQQFAGSGVIIDVDRESGDMTVVTNCHVVYYSEADGDGFCDDIKLYLYGSEYLDDAAITAQIVGTSKTFDLAVLKVSGSDIVKNSYATAAEWVDDEEVYLGQTVYAIGNPAGEKMSVTQGIISKDSENISIDLSDSTSNSETYSYRVLRTDTAINGGNSGGGLFNSDGKIVGIINAKTISDQIDNMNYALPASTSRRVVQNILNNYSGTETHGINRAMIGITSTAKSVTARYNTTTNLTELIEDVEIASIESNSKFASSLVVGDKLKSIKITSSDGNVKEEMTVQRMHNLPDAMLSVLAGDTVTLVIQRDGTEYTFTETYSATDISKAE